MMELISVDGAKHTASEGMIELSITADLDDGAGTVAAIPYGWNQNLRDPHGLYPQVDAWMAAHPDFQIADYVAPTPSTDPNDYQLQRYQFLAMLTIANLDSLVAPAIAAISDNVQRAVAQAKFDSTQTFQRDDPTLNLLAANAGLSSAQVDVYWMQAKDL